MLLLREWNRLSRLLDLLHVSVEAAGSGLLIRHKTLDWL